VIENYNIQTLEKVKVTAPTRVVCENPESMFNYFAWPTVTRLPDGRLAIYASGMRTRHVCPFGKVTVCYSEDDGKTWTKPEILVNTPLDDRDAGVAVSGNRVCLTTFNNTIAFQLGITESEPMSPKIKAAALEYLHSVDAESAEKKYLGSLYLISEDGGVTFGEPKKVPVTAPHGPCVNVDGKFLYVGRRMMAIKDAGAADGENKDEIQCYLENESGEFEFLSAIDNIVPKTEAEWELSCEPHATVLPSGKIIVHIRAQRFIPENSFRGWEDFTLYQSVSTDGGKTFSKPEALLPTLGGAPAHLYRTKNGTLISSYAFREYVDHSKPSAVCALISRDDGESWTPYYICAGEHSWDMGYPATVEKEDGTLFTIFYDHKGDGPAVIKAVDWELPRD